MLTHSAYHRLNIINPIMHLTTLYKVLHMKLHIHSCTLQHGLHIVTFLLELMNSELL